MPWAHGTVDGAFFAVESISAYSITDVVKFSTDGVSFGAVALTWVIREELWNSLSADLKKIIDEVANEQVLAACKKMEAYSIEAKVDAEKKGLTFLTALRKQRRRSNKSWISGLPGSGRRSSIGAGETAARSSPTSDCWWAPLDRGLIASGTRT